MRLSLSVVSTSVNNNVRCLGYHSGSLRCQRENRGSDCLSDPTQAKRLDC